VLDFKPGDIFFVMHHDSWLSKTIAWFMGSKWSHCGIILEETKFRTYTCETSDFEIVYSDLERYLHDPQVTMKVIRLPVSEDVGVDMAINATTRNQMMYGHLQLLFSLSVVELFRKIHIQIKNYLRQGIVCCEHVLYACKLSRIVELVSLDPYQLDTQQTHDILIACGAIEIFSRGA
jgi:hypothetical protein